MELMAIKLPQARKMKELRRRVFLMD